MRDAAQAADIFGRAAELNKEEPFLHGSRLELPNYGQVVMTGDLHGHRRNFHKLQTYCDLERFGARHVVIHELIHEDVESLSDTDTSHEMFLEAAAWKCEFPDQVHFLQSNHELAQVCRHEITKNGRVVTADFEAGVVSCYGTEATNVLEKMYGFIRTFPLAIRTPNRVMLSHSLPSPRELPAFDTELFSRPLAEMDFVERGSAHALVWGRYHTVAALEALAGAFDVDLFICGHQPQDTGYDVLHDRMVILASDHNHGVFLPFDLSKSATIESLTKNIRPFAGIA